MSRQLMCLNIVPDNEKLLDLRDLSILIALSGPQMRNADIFSLEIQPYVPSSCIINCIDQIANGHAFPTLDRGWGIKV